MKAYRDREVPKSVACPTCGAQVETEVLKGRVRWVTMTKVHVKAGGGTPRVCYAILKTKERRERSA